MTAFKDVVSGKKRALALQVEASMAELATGCLTVWQNGEAIDALLAAGIAAMPPCTRLYVVDRTGVQLSATASPQALDHAARGHDHSASPALTGWLPYRGLSLSNAYLSQPDMAPCITAVQAIGHDDSLLGFMVADFALNDLVLTSAPVSHQTDWRQFRGDPSIRGTLFEQRRTFSLMDEYMDKTLHIARVLMQHHGVFHIKLHFSSARATVWHINDPFNYRLHTVEECISPDICLAYPATPYPENATVAPTEIWAVLRYFKLLREADDNIYLRSASLNIMNATVGLTFSCDGSHYVPVKDLLQRDLTFWFGTSSAANATPPMNCSVDGPLKAS